jgi:hypothetical protein
MLKLDEEINKRNKGDLPTSFFAELPKYNTHLTKNALHGLAACFASPHTKSPSATALA